MESDKKLDGYSIHMLTQIGVSIRNPIIVPPKYDGSQFKFDKPAPTKITSRGLDVPFFVATGIPLFKR